MSQYTDGQVREGEARVAFTCPGCSTVEEHAAPRMAKLIQVKRHGRTGDVVIDGVPLPWYISRKIDVNINLDEAPSVTFTVWADRVEVEDDLGSQPEPEPAPKQLKDEKPSRNVWPWVKA